MNTPSLPVIREASAVSSLIKQTTSTTANSPSQAIAFINKSQAIKRAEFRINSIRHNSKSMQLPSLSKNYKARTQTNHLESKKYETSNKERILVKSKPFLKLPKLGVSLDNNNNNQTVHFIDEKLKESPESTENALFTKLNNFDANQKDSFDQMNDENAFLNFLGKFDSYERSKSPIDESIWSKEIQTTTTKPKNATFKQANLSTTTSIAIKAQQVQFGTNREG